MTFSVHPKLSCWIDTVSAKEKLGSDPYVQTINRFMYILTSLYRGI
jgi:hypothetical protein